MSLNSVTKLVLIFFQCLIVVSGSTNGHHELLLETECHKDADCIDFVKMDRVSNSTCFNYRCVCVDSDHKTIACLPEQRFTNVIGGKCPCDYIRWSSCMDGFCRCKPDYIPSEDNRNCIPRNVPIGNHCENNAQCSERTAFATCSNNTCSCESKFILYNGTCQSLVVLDRTKCTNDTECPNTICVPQHCYCKPGYVAKFNETACLPIADYNGNCSESVQCQHKLGLGGVCEQGKCICNEDFSAILLNVANERRTVCGDRIAIGQMCTSNSDCLQSQFNGTDQSMHCFLKECQCAPGFELDPDHRSCIKSNTTMENTWFNSILAKIHSSFASSSGNRNTIRFCITFSILIISFGLLL